MPDATRRMLGNSLWLFSGEILSRFLAAGYQILLARYLGTLLFGEFTLAMALAAILGVLSDFGLSSLTVREVSRSRDRPWGIVSSALRARAGLAVLLLALATAVSAAAGQPGRATALLAVLLGTQLVQGQGEILSAAYRGREEVALPVVLAFACRLGLVFSGILAVVLGAPVVVLALLTTVWALPLPLLLARRLPGRGRDRSAHPPFALLIRALPLGLGAALWAFYFRADLVILGWLEGDEAVGVYAAAFRLVEAVLLLQGPLLAAAFPLLSRRDLPEGEIQDAFLLLVRILTLIGVPFVVLFVVEGRELLGILFGAAYVEASPSLGILGFAILASFLAAPFLTLFICRNRERIYLLAMAMGAVLNPALDLILIPRLGLRGAAVATLATEIAILVLAVARAPALACPSRIPGILVRTATAGLGTAFALLLARKLGIPFALRAGVGILVAYPLVALVLGAIRPRDIAAVFGIRKETE